MSEWPKRRLFALAVMDALNEALQMNHESRLSAIKRLRDVVADTAKLPPVRIASVPMPMTTIEQAYGGPE